MKQNVIYYLLITITVTSTEFFIIYAKNKTHNIYT